MSTYKPAVNPTKVYSATQRGVATIITGASILPRRPSVVTAKPAIKPAPCSAPLFLRKSWKSSPEYFDSLRVQCFLQAAYPLAHPTSVTRVSPTPAAVHAFARVFRESETGRLSTPPPFSRANRVNTFSSGPLPRTHSVSRTRTAFLTCSYQR
jgi:hypothetical protein